MSVWTTKSLNKNSEYILLKHTLPGVNNNVMGVKFRHGFAAVEKGSKTYFQLLKTPMLKGAKELPITFLNKLPFITRSSDVKTIFGVDVYNYYITKLNAERQIEAATLKQQEEKEHIEEGILCTFRNKVTNKDELCSMNRHSDSPSGYCFRHFLEDPKLDLFDKPMAMTKEERRKYFEKVIKNIDKYLKKD